MEEKDFIKELFQDKLGSHEVPVNPKLWTSVSSSLSNASVVGSSGLSFLAKTLIGGFSAAALISGWWVYSTQKTEPKKPTSEKTTKSLTNLATPFIEAKPETETAKHEIVENNDLQDSLLINFQFGIPVEQDQPLIVQGITDVSSGSDVEEIADQKNAIANNPQANTTSAKNIPNAVNDASLSETAHSTVPQLEDQKIQLPNIFTPNGDGQNDVFSIDLSAFSFKDYSLVILNKNNQVVFKSNDPNEAWDGKKIDGDLCLAGTYVYYLTGETIDGKTISKFATLQIQY